jgi:hypothetical protein
LAATDQWTGNPVMNGKGDKRRPSSVSQSQFDENWNKAFNRNQIQNDWNQQGQSQMLREVTYEGMWKHSCTTMMETFFIGKDEVCDACGAWEEDGQ